ncbi:MAG: DUF2231 domain-containing protein [Saprospiraceae bacterium]
MKIFGHPVHIMLIHFPSALFPVHVLFAILGKYTFSVELIKAGFYVNTIGCLLGWLAFIFGVFDLFWVFKNRTSLVQKVLIHGGVNSIVLIGFTIFTLIQIKRLPDFTEDSIWIILIKSTLILLLLVGNYLGGNLVLKHKIGVES